MHYGKEFNMIVLIDAHNEKFIMIGTDYGHPFIETDKFSYCNSDGSGPNLELNKKISSHKILKQLKKYYIEFCKNKYH